MKTLHCNAQNNLQVLRCTLRQTSQSTAFGTLPARSFIEASP